MSERVLFVDDEKHILDGLKRLLWSAADRWQLRFAESGVQALQLLEQEAADVVVTDMRMPGMDGAELLTKVQEKYPGSVRIILSGYADEDAVMRTVGPAHQYLAKPCDSKLLIETIQRALGLRKYLANNEAQLMVTGVERLPSLPKTYADLVEHLKSPNASAASVARIIERDVAMLAQTMKLTNSAYFGLPTHVESPIQAVRLLGFDTIRSLVLLVGVYDQFKGDARAARMIERLSQRSNSIGALAKSICKFENTSSLISDHAFTAGVLSHVGTLLLVAEAHEKFGRAIAAVDGEGVGIVDAEQSIFGICHAGVGAYLLGLWGFHDRVVEAVAFHHNPGEAKDTEFSALSAVHAAQFLTHCPLSAARAGDFSKGYLDLEYYAALGLSAHLDAWEMLASVPDEELPAA